MKLLLDTHTVIWYIRDNPRLPKHIRQMIKDESNVVYVSTISLWEIAIKSRLGKLDMNRSFRDVVRLLHANGFRFLTIRLRHFYRLNRLELHHKDPFDRMLIAQSLAENVPLVSNEEVFDLYDVQRFW